MSITLLPGLGLTHSLLSAISLIYWFGNQGVLKDTMQAFGIDQIYGAPGVFQVVHQWVPLAMVFVHCQNLSVVLSLSGVL